MAESTALDVLLQNSGASLVEEPQEDIPNSLEEGADGADEPESSETDETESPEVAQTLSVKELAKLLERDPAELYEALQLDIGGEKVSLGEYKDRAKELASVDVLMAQATEQKLAAERHALEQNRALKLSAEKLGINLTPEMVEDANEQFRAYSEAEGLKLLEAKPEWKDPDKQRVALDRIERTMKSFGFSDVEIQNSVDHRLRLVFDQLGTLQDLLKDAASSEVKTRRPKKARKQRRTGRGTVERINQAHESGKLSTTDAVVGLIADGASNHGSNKP